MDNFKVHGHAGIGMGELIKFYFLKHEKVMEFVDGHKT